MLAWPSALVRRHKEHGLLNSPLVILQSRQGWGWVAGHAHSGTSLKGSSHWDLP